MAKVEMGQQVQNEILAVVRSWRKTLAVFQGAAEKALLPQTDVLSFAIALDNSEDAALTEDHQKLKYALKKTPYANELIKTKLGLLVSTDQHLKATCLNAWGLAKALDRLVLNALGGAQITENIGGSSDESIASYVINRLFEGSYSRTALVHLYNFSLDQSVLELVDINARILQLTATDVPLVTGESTWISSLHYPHTGNYFLAYEDSGHDNDWDWLNKKWQEAWFFIQVFKYFKYGIIDIDYAGIFFKPTWANEIRKYGVYILGRARWDAQGKPYHLTDSELLKLRTYLSALQAFKERIYDFSTELRRSIGFAGDYYELHHTRIKKEDQLVDLAIALEALFSPQHEGELRYRISQHAAVVLGNNAEERTQIFRFIRRMYDARSTLVHGGKNPFEDGTVKEEDIARLGDCLREAILRFLILYMRGETKRNPVLDEIALATLDPEKAAILRDSSDVDRYLKEKGLSK